MFSVGDLVPEAVVGDVVVSEAEGEAVGGEDGHADPRRVPPVGPDLQLLAGKPAGMSPHKRALLHTRNEFRLVSAANSLGIEPVNWFS